MNTQTVSNTSTGGQAARRESGNLRLSTLAALLRNPWLWVAGIAVLAFLLRRYHLGVESLWFDEADIVAQARQPLSTLIESFTKAGENGPLYTLMLHYWLAFEGNVPGAVRLINLLFGSAYEAHVRGLSMLFGTVAIPVMFAFARRLGGVTLGLISAGLLAINPFHLWYSQDAKMYSLLVLMTLLTSLLYLRAIERNSIAAWAAYVVATWVMLTTHSLASLVLLAQIIVVPLVWKRTTGIPNENPDRRTTTATNPQSRYPLGERNPQSAQRWFWAIFIILVPIFPVVWLRVAAIVTGTVETGNWYTSTGLLDILLTISVKFAVNQVDPAIPWELIGAVTMGLVAGVGVWALTAKGKGRRTKDESTEPTRKSTVLLFALWIVPILVFWVMTLFLPLFHPRYLIMSLPAYLVLVALGLIALRRINVALVSVAAGLLGLATGAALLSINYSTTPQKEDWRGAMVYVQDHIRLRDTIVAFPGYLESAVRLYYKPGGPGQVPDRPIETVHNLKTSNYGEREMSDELHRIVDCKERAWLIISPVREAQEDPQHKVLQWFQSNWLTFDTKEFNGVTVYGISFNGQPNCWFPKPVVSEPHKFESGLGFLGYTYELRDDESDDPKQPDASYFPLTLYWHSPDHNLPDYDIRVRVITPDGKVVKDEALGPLNGYWPTSQWYHNIDVIDYRDLRLPGGLTPGNYSVSVQVTPKGQPDNPLKLDDGSTEMVLQQPLKVIPWKP